MPWFMPSYGRPDAPAKLLAAPGGMPDDVVVLVNEDDPAYEAYVDASLTWPAGWKLLRVPERSRFCGAAQWGFLKYRDANYFGIIDDDYWPITPGWYDKMIDAAGGTGVAIANNKQNFPHPWCCRVMGGALARAIGTIAPGTMRHNFSDDSWKRFADDFNLYRPLQDVIVEHHHHTIKSDVKADATYLRGSSDYAEDERRYKEWLNSDERMQQCERVAKLLGVTLSTRESFKDVRLAIITPVGDHKLDLAFHQSLWNTLKLHLEKGINTFFFHQAGASNVGKTREAALWQAYYSTPPVTHFMWIDSDMGWDARLIKRLIASGHEFTGVSGVKKTDKVEFCFNPLPGKQVVIHPKTKFIGVDHVGFGFVMHTRSVIDKLIAAYPDLEYHSHNEGRREYALFLEMITGNRNPNFTRERLSEDLSFCERWRMIGGEIWLDPDAALIHAGRKEYTGAARIVMQPNAA